MGTIPKRIRHVTIKPRSATHRRVKQNVGWVLIQCKTHCYQLRSVNYLILLFLSPPFLWVSIAPGWTICIPIEAICILCYKILAIYVCIRFLFTVKTNYPARPPIAAVIFLPRSVQLSSAGTHRAWLINLYSRCCR